MRRLVRVALGAAILVGILSAGRLSLPQVTVACSCVAPVPGAPVFRGDEEAVVVGTVGAGDGSGIFPFTVERWFRGGGAATIRLASATQRLPDGTFVTSSCGADLQPGWHVIIVATLDRGIYTPGVCQPFAAVETADGQRTIQAAIATFGNGVAPDAPLEPTGGPAIDLALLAILGVVAVVVVVMLGVVVSFGRRDSGARP